MNENWYSKVKYKEVLASIDEESRKAFDAQRLLAQIASDMPANHPLKGKAYIAGGAVRDEFLGKIPKDIDIVVSAPNGGIAYANYLARLLGLREPVVYPTFGTAQIMLKDVTYNGEKYNVGGMEIEFVHTRKEQYHEESRKPETSFGTIKEDVERRDLTVNSLLKRLESGPSKDASDAKQKVVDGEILDLTGMGISDLENGIVRTPLDPDIIFSDDPLRMMRAIRFTVKYGWSMDDEIKEGIIKNIDRIDIVSRERIRDELDKIIGVRKLHEAIPLMDEVGLLSKVLPEMAALKGIEQDPLSHSEGDAFVHTLLTIENMEKNHPDVDPSALLAAIAHDWGKATTQMTEEDGRIRFIGHERDSVKLIENRLRELKYPVKTINRVKKLVNNHMRGHQARDWGPKAFRRFIREMGDEYDDILALLDSDEKASVPENGEREFNYGYIKDRMQEILKEKTPDKPVFNGNEIMTLFNIKPGPQIKQIMDLVDDIVLGTPSLFIEGDELTTKANIANALMADPRLQQIIGENNDLV